MYSFRSDLVVAKMDVSRRILVLDTSISETSNSERREYFIICRSHDHVVYFRYVNPHWENSSSIGVDLFQTKPSYVDGKVIQNSARTPLVQVEGFLICHANAIWHMTYWPVIILIVRLQLLNWSEVLREGEGQFHSMKWKICPDRLNFSSYFSSLSDLAFVF